MWNLLNFMCRQIIFKKFKLNELNRISLWTVYSCLAIVSDHCHRKPMHSGVSKFRCTTKTRNIPHGMYILPKAENAESLRIFHADGQLRSSTMCCSSTSKSHCESDSNLCLQNVQNTCGKTFFKAWLNMVKIGKPSPVLQQWIIV